MKKIFITAFILVLIDQVIKVLIKTHFELGPVKEIFDWFIIHFTENPGMAFGIELFNKAFLTIFRVSVVVIGIFYVKSIIKPSFPAGGLISLGLIIGGAIGNIIDSTFYGVIFSESTHSTVARFLPETGGYSSLLHGSVVDMFYFPFFTVDLPNWLSFLEGNDGFTFFAPIFNIADAGISIGIFIILLFYRKIFN